MRKTDTSCRLRSALKRNTIGADAAAKNPFPLEASERLHVTLERIGLHLIQNPPDTALNIAGQAPQIPLGSASEFRGPGHALPGSKGASFLLSIA